MNSTRRKLIKSGLAATAGITLYPWIQTQHQQFSMHPKICIFSKCLQFLSYSQIADVVTDLGFDGVDLTVRKNGHVLPENVKTDLPKAVNELQKASKTIPMIATDIVDADSQETEDILRTASSLGIKYYRIGRFIYDRSKNIIQNLNNYKQTLDKLDKLNRRYKIHGCIQNHSGSYNIVGAPVWDLHFLLKDFDPEFIGVQYDIMHATAEGGYSWPLGLELMTPWIKTVDIKNFIWEVNKSGKWNAKITPLSDGMVDYNKFMREIKRLNIQATYSIHYEYDLGGAEHGNFQPEMKQHEIFKRIKKDISFFKALNHI